MERHFYIGGQRVEVDEIDDVVALRLAPGSARSAGDFGRAADAELANFEFTRDQADAFTAAGWVFVVPDEPTRGDLSRGDRPVDAERAGTVVTIDGRLAVASNALTVQLAPGLDAAAVTAALQEAQLTVVNQLRFAPHLYEVETGGRDAIQASADLESDPRFVVAEPVLEEHIPGRATPDDPDYDEQWQWSNGGADVNIEPAWDHTRGAGMRVGVIDNGFDADHEDLAAGVGARSGFFSAGSPATFTQGTGSMPDSNHGTFCAGLVGARWNNNTGVTGAAGECQLTLVACLGDQIGTQVTLARAVSYAADPSMEVAGADPNDGVDVLVSSLGPNGADWTLTTALRLAIEFAAANGRGGRGLCIFWAASNGNNVAVASDEVVSHPDVIAVVRSDDTDTEDNAARGDEVELIAPGVNVYSTRSGDDYGNSTGTSFAAPIAAGCATLALSADPDMTRDELRQVMGNTAAKIGGVTYDANGHHDDYGFGRVDAFEAVRLAAREVELVTSSVAFNDLPEGETTARAIVWHASGLDALTFEITAGPTTTSGPPNSFEPLLGTTVTVAAPGLNAAQPVRLWLRSTGTTAGDTAVGNVDVRCVETGQTWTVTLSANTIVPPVMGVALVLDESGSMSSDAGNGRARVEVLRDAAQSFIDTLKPAQGIGVTRFESDASLAMSVVPAGPENFGAGRSQATAAVAGHAPVPGGRTSIGDGVELAHGELAAVQSDYDGTAMIVLTDGRENEPKLIADVAGLIGDRVFAIGLGDATAIDPESLTELTDGTGGYVAVTGAIPIDDPFRLTKYYLQILAGVSNEEVVLDPDGHLKAGGTVSVPFHLNQGDPSADVILMTPWPAAMEYVLEAPSGEIITPGTPGVTFFTGRNLAYFRFNLPVVSSGGIPNWGGRWTAHVSCTERGFYEYLYHVEKLGSKWYQYVETHGIRWAVEVHARSSIKLRAEVDQSGRDPGSEISINARVREFDLPIEDRVEVVAELTGPTGDDVLPLHHLGGGEFATAMIGSKHGLYRFRIVANGKSLRGERFSRELTKTAAIYVPRPNDEDGDDHGGGGHQDPCHGTTRPPKCTAAAAGFSKAMNANPRLAAGLDAALHAQGTSLHTVAGCLGATIRPSTGTSGIGQVDVDWPVDRPDRPIGRSGNDVAADALRSLADLLDTTGDGGQRHG